MIKGIIKGIKHLLTRRIVENIIQPKRLKKFDAQTEPFVYRTPEGLVFELWPNEYVDRVIAVEGIFERKFLHYIRSILPQNAIMLDIGANIGNHAIFLAAGCQEIHCFEPNPKVAARLRRNIAHNKLTDRISVHEYGLGDRNETLTFAEHADGNLGASKFVRSGEGLGNEYRTVQLEVKCAAAAIASLNLGRIDFIKIDVEGMEEAVLTALKPIIARYRPIVSFEHHEKSVTTGTFSRIRNVFEDYRLMDQCYLPEFSAKDKLIWHIKHDGGPVLTEVVEPEQRTYDNVLAIPSAAIDLSGSYKGNISQKN